MLVAKDVMTSKVVTVALGATVHDVATALISNRISAVPVIDGEGNIAGIVSEGDLFRRVELETHGSVHSGLAAFFGDHRKMARDYVKSHAVKVTDIMVADVITVGQHTELTDIAKLFAKYGIKRVPVVDGKRLLGIVSRADLVRALAHYDGDISASVDTGDEEIRKKLLDRLDEASWLKPNDLSIFVNDGVVQLWGRVYSEEEREALRIAAETLPGVTGVEEHLANTDEWSYI